MPAEILDRPVFDGLVLFGLPANFLSFYFLREKTRGRAKAGPQSHLKKNTFGCERVIQITSVEKKLDLAGLWLKSFMEEIADGAENLGVFGEKRMRAEIKAVAILPNGPGKPAHLGRRFEDQNTEPGGGELPSET